ALCSEERCEYAHDGVTNTGGEVNATVVNVQLLVRTIFLSLFNHFIPGHYVPEEQNVGNQRQRQRSEEGFQRRPSNRQRRCFAPKTRHVRWYIQNFPANIEGNLTGKPADNTCQNK